MWTNNYNKLRPTYRRFLEAEKFPERLDHFANSFGHSKVVQIHLSTRVKFTILIHELNPFLKSIPSKPIDTVRLEDEKTESEKVNVEQLT